MGVCTDPSTACAGCMEAARSGSPYHRHLLPPGYVPRPVKVTPPKLYGQRKETASQRRARKKDEQRRRARKGASDG